MKSTNSHGLETQKLTLTWKLTKEPRVANYSAQKFKRNQLIVYLIKKKNLISN